MGKEKDVLSTMPAYAFVAGLSGYSSRNEIPWSHDLPIRGSNGIAPKNGIPAEEITNSMNDIGQRRSRQSRVERAGD